MIELDYDEAAIVHVLNLFKQKYGDTEVVIPASVFLDIAIHMARDENVATSDAASAIVDALAESVGGRIAASGNIMDKLEVMVLLTNLLGAMGDDE